MDTPGPGTQVAFDVVDVFAESRFRGNQLAVVHGAGGLTQRQCLTLAQEFGFSETTFPEPRDDGSYAVRIFTPAAEIPFAGHPTLGTAWVLRRDGALHGAETVQHCGAGEIEVRFSGDAERDVVELGAVPRDLVGPLPADLVADLAADLGLDTGDVAGPVWLAGCGLTFVQLPVSASAVDRARPSYRPLSEYADRFGALGRTRDPVEGVSVHHVVDGVDRLEVEARVFVPGVGVPEDPATGSAAAGLGLALVARGLLGDGGRYRISQGVAMGRPSVLDGRVSVTGDRVERCYVAGQVHPVASGSIAVPPA